MAEPEGVRLLIVGGGPEAGRFHRHERPRDLRRQFVAGFRPNSLLELLPA